MIEKEVKVQAPPKEDGLTDLLATERIKPSKYQNDEYDFYLKDLEYRK